MDYTNHFTFWLDEGQSVKEKLDIRLIDSFLIVRAILWTQETIVAGLPFMRPATTVTMVTD